MNSRKPKIKFNPLATILKTVKGDCEIKIVLTIDHTILHVFIEHKLHSLDCKITHQQNAIPSKVILVCCRHYCQQFPSILDPVTADLQALMPFLDRCDQATFSERPFLAAGWTKPVVHEVVYG